MLLSTIVTELNNVIPYSDAESWDNVGLLVGDPCAEITKVIVTLDATPDVITDAEKGTLIIAHHPLIFNPQRSFTKTTPFSSVGRAFEAAFKGVAIIALHTNLDKSNLPCGTNSALIRALGASLDSVQHGPAFLQLVQAESFNLPLPMSRHSFAKHLTDRLRVALEHDGVEHGNAFKFADGWNTDQVKEGDVIAICSGSGMSLLEEAVGEGAKMMITGDVKHHEAQDAFEHGVSVLDLTHFASETIFLREFASFVSSLLSLPCSVHRQVDTFSSI